MKKVPWTALAVALLLLSSSAKHSEASFSAISVNIDVPMNIVDRFLPFLAPQINAFTNTGKQIEANFQKDLSRFGIPGIPGAMGFGRAFQWVKDIAMRGYLLILNFYRKAMMSIKI